MTDEGDLDDAEMPFVDMPADKYQIVFGEGCDTLMIGPALLDNINKTARTSTSSRRPLFRTLSRRRSMRSSPGSWISTRSGATDRGPFARYSANSIARRCTESTAPLTTRDFAPRVAPISSASAAAPMVIAAEPAAHASQLAMRGDEGRRCTPLAPMTTPGARAIAVAKSHPKLTRPSSQECASRKVCSATSTD